MNEADPKYQNFVERVQSDLGLIIEKWKEHFARRLDETWEGFFPRFDRDPLGEMPDAIKDIVNTAKERLNAFGHRNGEASLLIRDPREDRLVLTYSTSNNLNRGTADPMQVKDPSHYFDVTLKRYVYPLHDTLADAQERRSEVSQRSRGLTGWVAVSGHHLLVNGEYGGIGLASIAEDRPETLAMCNTYGHPIWGRHISEAPGVPGKPKRYIAVPVKSSFDPDCTVGVLRYACPRTGTELHQIDVIFMSELAQIVGAMLGLEAATTRTFRESLFPDEADSLRRTYNFRRFLGFMAVSLRSSIASLYIEIGDISSPKFSKLRLVDAYGIRGAVGPLRNKIKDYSEGEYGFTRWLYDQQDQEPSVEDSVHTHTMWEGKNTEVFYGQHFAKLKPGGAAGVPTEVARKYTIKIIGIPVFFEGDKIGVLKVELPSRFDDRRHYGRHDKIFLKQCAAEIGPVLGALRLLLRGEVTKTADLRTVVNVTRMAAQLFRTRLVSPNEAENCWKALTDFFQENPDQVTEEMSEILERFPHEDKNIVKNITAWLKKDAGEWLKKVGNQATIEILTRIFTGG
jgi:hypothetical protein